MQPLGDPMLYADLHDSDLARKLAALAPVPGHCICIDIVGSTGLKGAGLDAWVSATLEAFACVRSCLYAKFPPIKSIGDALMFFIPSDAMQGETAASLLTACCDMAVERQITAATRIAGVLCDEAYPITFMPGGPDYHGTDIDLSSAYGIWPGLARWSSIVGSMRRHATREPRHWLKSFAARGR